MSVSAEVSERVIQTCRQAAEASRAAVCRQGNLLVFSPDQAEEVVVSADLHGNRLNFQQICRIADLESHPRRHLVVQEVCHGGPTYPDGEGCMSHLLLEDVAQWKLRYPDRFHFLLSNHELAELMEFPISKQGRMLNLQFRLGVQQLYGDAMPRVRQAYMEFIGSCPIAARTANGLFICHGSPEHVDQFSFSTSVFERPLRPQDLCCGGDVFRLMWGRDFRAANAEALATAFGAELLIHGHEPCSAGFAVPNHRQIILDCCTTNGHYVILPITRPLSQAEAVQRITRLYAAAPGAESVETA
jgi:hypothetical protein